MQNQPPFRSPDSGVHFSVQVKEGPPLTFRSQNVHRVPQVSKYSDHRQNISDEGVDNVLMGKLGFLGPKNPPNRDVMKRPYYPESDLPIEENLMEILGFPVQKIQKLEHHNADPHGISSYPHPPKTIVPKHQSTQNVSPTTQITKPILNGKTESELLQIEALKAQIAKDNAMTRYYNKKYDLLGNK